MKHLLQLFIADLLDSNNFHSRKFSLYQLSQSVSMETPVRFLQSRTLISVFRVPGSE